jgi:hypothetical protein
VNPYHHHSHYHSHFQENNREKLDKDYDELLKESLLDFNKKNKKYDKEDKNEEKEIIDEYDVALNAMLYDVKTKPTDRYICIYTHINVNIHIFPWLCSNRYLFEQICK